MRKTEILQLVLTMLGSLESRHTHTDTNKKIKV